MISSSSRPGAKPDADKAEMTDATRLRFLNCVGDRFTATLTSRDQLAASVQAFRSTQSPIWTIKPVSSAMGMNSAG